LLRIINFIKNWIKVDQRKFLDSGLGTHFVLIPFSRSFLAASLKAFLAEVPPKWAPLLEMALIDKPEQSEGSDGDLAEQMPRMI
jgi:hypothetical protein